MGHNIRKLIISNEVGGILLHDWKVENTRWVIFGTPCGPINSHQPWSRSERASLDIIIGLIRESWVLTGVKNHIDVMDMEVKGKSKEKGLIFVTRDERDQIK